MGVRIKNGDVFGIYDNKVFKVCNTHNVRKG
jgi:hypothetical protein